MTSIHKPSHTEVTQQDQRGMILVNVLVIVMLATAVLAIMLTSQDIQVARSTHEHFAAQAMAIARGGELSAITALRRDLAHDLAQDRMTDTLTEPWANIADRDARIVTGNTGGNFSFVVTDAQSHFNINNWARGDALSAGAITALATTAGIRPGRIAHVLEFLHSHGPIDDLSDLRAADVTESELQVLALFCVALPGPTTVNVNTAPEPLLTLLTGDPAIARTIIQARATGGIGPSGDIAGRNGSVVGHILLPPGTGVSSEYFWARARVTTGGTSQQLTSLLHRRIDQGLPVVTVIARWRGAAPLAAPPLPQ